ncbi:hypothetical protein VTI74DRAFT_2440 [Chaetomium olivicolor]
MVTADVRVPVLREITIHASFKNYGSLTRISTIPTACAKVYAASLRTSVLRHLGNLPDMRALYFRPTSEEQGKQGKLVPSSGAEQTRVPIPGRSTQSFPCSCTRPCLEAPRTSPHHRYPWARPCTCSCQEPKGRLVRDYKPERRIELLVRMQNL